MQPLYIGRGILCKDRHRSNCGGNLYCLAQVSDSDARDRERNEKESKNEEDKITEEIQYYNNKQNESKK